MTLILMYKMTLILLMYKMTRIPKYSYPNVSDICEFGKYDIIFTKSSSMG